MKPSLASFQDAFVDALYDTESSTMDSLTQQPGFAVYRNTVLKGTTDALLANFLPWSAWWALTGLEAPPPYMPGFHRQQMHVY